MIAVLGAMDCEIQSLLGWLSDVTVEHDGAFTWHRGRHAGVELVVAKCGVGKVLAACCAQRVIDRFSPAAIINTGVAGGLLPELKLGDVVVSTDCVQHDMDVRAIGFKRGQIPYTEIFEVVADKHLLELALGSAVGAHKILAGRILSGDQFITSKDKELESLLRVELCGTAVEMEGASIGIVSMLNKIPFLIVRTISDSADGSAAEDYMTLKDIVAKNSLAVVEHILQNL